MAWIYEKLYALGILQTCESYGFMKIMGVGVFYKRVNPNGFMKMRVGVFYKRVNPNGFMKIMLVFFLQTYES